DHDLVIPCFGMVGLLTVTRSERCTHCADVVIVEDAVKPLFVDVQYFAAEREDRLCGRIPAGFRRPARRVTLDDEQFTFRRILARTVRKFTRQAGYLKRGFPACHLPCLVLCTPYVPGWTTSLDT